MLPKYPLFVGVVVKGAVAEGLTLIAFVEAVVLPGFPNSGVLKAFKASARNWKWTLSVTAKSLKMEMFELS